MMHLRNLNLAKFKKKSPFFCAQKTSRVLSNFSSQLLQTYNAKQAMRKRSPDNPRSKSLPRKYVNNEEKCPPDHPCYNIKITVLILLFVGGGIGKQERRKTGDSALILLRSNGNCYVHFQRALIHNEYRQKC